MASEIKSRVQAGGGGRPPVAQVGKRKGMFDVTDEKLMLKRNGVHVNVSCDLC